MCELINWINIYKEYIKCLETLYVKRDSVEITGQNNRKNAQLYGQKWESRLIWYHPHHNIISENACVVITFFYWSLYNIKMKKYISVLFSVWIS